MKKIFKLYLLGFFLLSDFIVFAQSPGTDTGGGEPPLEGTPDPQPSSVDSKLIYLLLIGLFFGIYIMQKRSRKA
jgi:hypothetical protein